MSSAALSTVKTRPTSGTNTKPLDTFKRRPTLPLSSKKRLEYVVLFVGVVVGFMEIFDYGFLLWLVLFWLAGAFSDFHIFKMLK